MYSNMKVVVQKEVLKWAMHACPHVPQEKWTHNVIRKVTLVIWFDLFMSFHAFMKLSTTQFQQIEHRQYIGKSIVYVWPTYTLVLVCARFCIQISNYSNFIKSGATNVQRMLSLTSQFLRLVNWTIIKGAMANFLWWHRRVAQTMDMDSLSITNDGLRYKLPTILPLVGKLVVPRKIVTIFGAWWHRMVAWAIS